MCGLKQIARLPANKGGKRKEELFITMTTIQKYDDGDLPPRQFQISYGSTGVVGRSKLLVQEGSRLAKITDLNVDGVQF